MPTELVFLLAAAAIAGIAAWLVARSRPVGVVDPKLAATLTEQQNEIVRLTADAKSKQDRIAEWERSYAKLKTEADGEAERLRGQLAVTAGELSGLQATLDAERRAADEKLAQLLLARDDLKAQFRVLASEVLDEKSKTFVEVNQKSLSDVLTPLQTELTGFRQKVEEIHASDLTQHGELRAHLQQLRDLNTNLQAETTSLTRALKGESKTQGDWGEMILDQMLEKVGFIAGEQFTKQDQQRDADGNTVIPDIVIHMPGKRHLVIDSKVTLTAYVAYVAATDDDSRNAALAEHLTAVKRHIKGLSEKNYQELYGLESLDFVVMFMPVEGAFHLALQHDPALYQDAWTRNVMLVSPSTLLFAIRTIAHVWRQEAQSRNHMEIAERGRKLYDKFVSFAEDLLDVGEHLKKARESYDAAHERLSTGSGNLVGQAQQLIKLGVKAKKKLPKELLGADTDGEDEEGDTPALPA